MAERVCESARNGRCEIRVRRDELLSKTTYLTRGRDAFKYVFNPERGRCFRVGVIVIIIIVTRVVGHRPVVRRRVPLSRRNFNATCIVSRFTITQVIPILRFPNELMISRIDSF